MRLTDMQTEAAVEAILHRIDEDAETCKDAIAAAVREQMFGGDDGDEYANEYETDAYGYAVNLHRLSVACDALEEAQTINYVEGGQPGRMFRFTLEIRVDSPNLVKCRAEAQAVKEGVKLKDWRETRRGTADDLVMLLDPGSIEGGSVFCSDAEELNQL